MGTICSTSRSIQVREIRGAPQKDNQSSDNTCDPTPRREHYTHDYSRGYSQDQSLMVANKHAIDTEMEKKLEQPQCIVTKEENTKSIPQEIEQPEPVNANTNTSMNDTNLSDSIDMDDNQQTSEIARILPTSSNNIEDTMDELNNTVDIATQGNTELTVISPDIADNTMDTGIKQGLNTEIGDVTIELDAATKDVALDKQTSEKTELDNTQLDGIEGDERNITEKLESTLIDDTQVEDVNMNINTTGNAENNADNTAANGVDNLELTVNDSVNHENLAEYATENPANLVETSSENPSENTSTEELKDGKLITSITESSPTKDQENTDLIKPQEEELVSNNNITNDIPEKDIGNPEVEIAQIFDTEQPPPASEESTHPGNDI
ncbi:hypothetical protein LOD99_5792 [Oopsacas minuta]|uniref:Uncharacterized protein n=1 Tax=Oopsacas minuta TaxID=111878 RepID=A0AAV7JQ65_9METZ|nr:hypothetical protein LOD99_5792 [Oopsacas minuta]